MNKYGPKEKWCPVMSYGFSEHMGRRHPGYEISNMGWLRTNPRAEPTYGSKNAKGYVMHSIVEQDHTRVRVAAHRLVAEAFLGFDPKDPSMSIRFTSKVNWRPSYDNLVIIQHGMPITPVPDCVELKVPGVAFNKRKGKWQAYHMTEGKQKHLGYFSSKQEATQTRVRYIQDLNLSDLLS